jgi:esterase/lipase superfamily enzyme
MANVRVFFVTNRNYLGTGKAEVFGRSFNPDGVAALRFGYADYIPNKTTPLRKDIHVYPDKKEKTEITATGGGLFMEDLHAIMAGSTKTDTLVFIHGFNVTFLGALDAGALLGQNLKVDGHDVNVVVFSWPSDGSAVPVMAYYSDREDARVSGPALARAFLKLREFVTALPQEDYCQRRIHLLAHSMGNYVLRNGLQALLAKDRDSLIRLFDQIMMAAPDEDDDTFEHESKLRLLPRIGRQVTVYFNPGDRALLVSDKTKANPDRLGSDGPRLVDLLPKKVVPVDCRKVASAADRWAEHSYYLRSKALENDMNAVMADTPPEDIRNRTFIDRTRSWRLIREPKVKTAVEVPPPAETETPAA